MNDSERQDLGQRVMKARTARGWSKEKLADKAEITTTTLRRIEGGLRVQDAKLQLALDALGLGRDMETPDRWTEDQMHPMVYVLPPEIELGYLNVARFSQAVSEEVPELADRATRLALDAAGLFSDAGNAILNREKGGDGNAEQQPEARGPAPTKPAMYSFDYDEEDMAARGEDTEKPRLSDD